ncbi:translocation/assembly module TamB domain-containing protein [Rubritalea sp.]|uniref:translocation/assembly module TamB domain-containing protein n=1 Tax=Rubritalea sp. TaxID=2109375 RepID=UPI003EF20B53
MAEEPTPPLPTKKRKWPKRCLWFLGIILVLLWSINGPIARKAAHFGINKALLSQGMKGDCQVEGTLTHGFTITDFSYNGVAGLQKIQLKEVAADYRLLRELIHGKIRSAHLTDATIIIDLDKFVSNKEKKESHKKIKDSLKLARKWLYQPEITLSNIDLTILKSSELMARFRLDKLHHPTNGDDYNLSNFQASDGSGIETPKQDVTLTWTPSHIELTRLEFFPDFAVNSAHVDWQNEISGTANLQVLSAVLDVEVNQTIDAKLTSGYLNAEIIEQRFGITLPLAFELNHIEANVVNWLAPMKDWEIDCKLDIPRIAYQDYLAESTRLTFSQKNAAYQLELNSTVKSAPIDFNISGTWLDPAAQNWWESTEATYSMECPRLADISSLIPQIPAQLQLADCSLKIAGTTSLKELELYSLDADLSASGIKVGEETLPALKLSGEYQHLAHGEVFCSFEQADDRPITANARYTFEDDHYQLNLDVNEDDPEWLNAMLKSFGVDIAIQSPLVINWKSNGSPDLSKQQLGSIAIESLKVKTGPELEFNLIAQAKYDWPKSLQLTSFELSEEDFLAKAKMIWDGKILKVLEGQIHREEKPIAKLTADIPFTAEITSLEKFLEQQAEWYLDLDILPLDIQKINEWLQLHEIKQIADLTGTVAMGIEFVGSPSNPDIKGYAKLENLKGISNKDLAPLHMLGEFNSADKSLSFSGQLLEASTERVVLKATLPFKPLEWVQNADDIPAILEDTTIDGELQINTLPLDRTARFVPQLKTIKGSLNGNAHISGTLADPKVELNTRINIPLLVTAGDAIDDIHDIEIICKANDDRLIDATLKATINGGLLESKANINLADLKNPEFEVTAKASYAMVFRNDAVSIRANADVKLEGTLEEATLSGSIGVVESLFYKDIDILPIGVPSSAVSDVELPALNAKLIDFDIPEPFNKWKLDLSLRFEDPLVISGNIARGQITGGIKATGTLGDPKLDGAIVAEKIIARLPFSKLRIHKGLIEFKSENGLIPYLDIQAKTTVNNYDVSIFVYGPATNPKSAFTSNPPLAENDVITLLATGVTASELTNNTGAATLRAAQLFLVKLQQEAGETRKAIIIEKLLAILQEFELNIKETDGFTGREYSSAQVQLTKRFYLAAQIDDDNQTRGLLIYVLRFR